MRTTTIIAALIAGCLTTAPATFAESHAKRTYVVGVSPNFEKADREGVLKSVLMLALEGASAGDAVVVYDALNLLPVARMTIPEGAQFEKNPRARIQKMKEDLGKLQRFFATDSEPQSVEVGLIHPPQFLALVGSQLRQPGQPLTVVLIGSPIYLDSKEPAFNMMDGFYPSDGHILSDRKASIYGTADSKDALKGVSIHYSYLRESFTNDTTRNSIRRFWALFIEEQGGVLASFAADLSLICERAQQNVQHPCVNASIDRNDAKIQMHRVIQRALPAKTDWVKNEIVPVQAPAIPAKEPVASALEIKETASEVKINVVGDILFDFDKAEIRQVAEPSLDQVVKMIQAHPKASVLIEGYTDSKGSMPYNLKLSDRRASAVKAFLVAKGIVEQNAWSRGCGADNSIAANAHPDGSDDPDGRQKNRRVEITIKK